MLVFSGCGNLPGSGTDPVTEKTTEATESDEWQYSASSPVYEVKPETVSVTISGLSEDLTVYLAKVNPTNTGAIPAQYTR